MRRKPLLQRIPVERVGHIVHDPQARAAFGLDLSPQRAFDLRLRQALRHDTQPLGDGLNLAGALGLAPFRPERRLGIIVAIGAQPEDTAGIGCAKVQRVLLGEQRLAHAAKSANLPDAARGHGRAGDLRDGSAMQQGMHLPHFRQAADKARRADRRGAVPHWGSERMNIGQRAIERTDMLCDGLREISQCRAAVAGRGAELGIAQLDGMDMFAALLGTDDQNAIARIFSSGLRGEEGGRQLPLAGAAQRIGLRVVGNQRRGLRQAFGDRVRDAGEVVDLLGVEPHPQPGGFESVFDLSRAVAVSPGVAEEDVVLRSARAHQRLRAYRGSVPWSHLFAKESEWLAQQQSVFRGRVAEAKHAFMGC